MHWKCQQCFSGLWFALKFPHKKGRYTATRHACFLHEHSNHSSLARSPGILLLKRIFSGSIWWSAHVESAFSTARSARIYRSSSRKSFSESSFVTTLSNDRPFFCRFVTVECHPLLWELKTINSSSRWMWSRILQEESIQLLFWYPNFLCDCKSFNCSTHFLSKAYTLTFPSLYWQVQLLWPCKALSTKFHFFTLKSGVTLLRVSPGAIRTHCTPSERHCLYYTARAHKGCMLPVSEILLVSLSNASDTRSRNLYQKLVQVVLYKKLARVSVNLVPVFPVQVSCTQLSTALFPARDLNGATWLAGQLLLFFVITSFRLFFVIYFSFH